MSKELKSLAFAFGVAALPFVAPAADLDDIVNILGKAGKIADSVSNSKQGSSSSFSSSATAAASPSVKDLAVATGFSEGTPSGTASSFPLSTKRVYVCFTPVNMDSGVSVQAIWHYSENGTMVKICEVSSKISGSAKAEFHLEPGAGAWPAGDYRVDLAVNGVTLGSSSFKMDPAAAVAAPVAAPAATTAAQSSQAPQPWDSAAQPQTQSQVQPQASQPSQDKGAAKPASTKALDDFFGN